ncbi:MAG: general secretion pathway protein C [Marinobacter sp. T13-3]|nr:MAG: general secretion pathway protein C [Marinobacter sp. T13-3]
MTHANLLANLTHPTLARWLTRLLAVALAGYLGIQASNLAWAVAWNDPLLPGLSAPTGQSASQTPKGSVAQYALFGTPNPTEPAMPAPIEAPETTLTLTLVGVMAGTDNSPSGAIVADSRGQTEYYRVGDTLPGNAELVRVDADRILLKRAGKHETLSFERDSSDSAKRLARAVTPTAPDTPVDRVRETLDKDGQQALDKLGMAPNGRGQGYVYNGQQAILNAIGLRSGDVVTALNGQRLGNLEQDIELLRTWRQEPTIKITIKRGNSTRTLNYAQPNL